MDGKVSLQEINEKSQQDSMGQPLYTEENNRPVYSSYVK
jgi:hypothetical protein